MQSTAQTSVSSCVCVSRVWRGGRDVWHNLLLHTYTNHNKKSSGSRNRNEGRNEKLQPQPMFMATG